MSGRLHVRLPLSLAWPRTSSLLCAGADEFDYNEDDPEEPVENQPYDEAVDVSDTESVNDPSEGSRSPSDPPAIRTHRVFRC